jgi:hypothetical protein
VPGDGGSKLLWNVDQYLPDCTVQLCRISHLHTRRRETSNLTEEGHIFNVCN